MVKENIYNVPNPVTFSRVIATPIIMWATISGVSLIRIMFAFIIAALTDFLDGQLARRLKGSSPAGNQVTVFGTKFDIIADRILMVGTIIALLIRFNAEGSLLMEHIVQFVLILTRELTVLPFIIYTYIKGTHSIPETRFIGKLTTFMQGIAFPFIILNIVYTKIAFSHYIIGATAICGIIAARQYLIDINIMKK